MSGLCEFNFAQLDKRLQKDINFVLNCIFRRLFDFEFVFVVLVNNWNFQGFKHWRIYLAFSRIGSFIDASSSFFQFSQVYCKLLRIIGREIVPYKNDNLYSSWLNRYDLQFYYRNLYSCSDSSVTWHIPHIYNRLSLWISIRHCLNFP